MHYKKWFILLLIPIAVLVIPHISFASSFTISKVTPGYGAAGYALDTDTYALTGTNVYVYASSSYIYSITSILGMSVGTGRQNYASIIASSTNWIEFNLPYTDVFNAPYNVLYFNATACSSCYPTSALDLGSSIVISTNQPTASIILNIPSTVYSDFPSWGFTASNLVSGTTYVYQIIYDTAPLTGGGDCFQPTTGKYGIVGYSDIGSFTATTSTQNLTLNKSGAFVRSDLTQFTNYINLNGYPTDLYTEICLENGGGTIQDTTSILNLAIGGTPINASSTNITIVSPSSTSTPVAPFANYIYGVTGVATDTQYTVNQTVTQYIDGIPSTPYTQTQNIAGANIISKGLTFQNRNELDNYGNATSVPMAISITISNGIGEIGWLSYNYTMLPFQMIGSNASTGLQQIINPNGTTTLINNIATDNGTASTTTPYSGTALSASCTTVSNIFDFGQDADYVSCKISNLINQLTFNVTQNLTNAINGTYNTFTGIFPIDVFADFNNDISIAQAFSNSTSSTPLVLKGQSIVDAITGVPTGQYTFGGMTMPVLNATTTSWIKNKAGFDYRTVIDYILYAVTGLIMLGGAIGVIVMIHKTTAGNA